MCEDCRITDHDEILAAARVDRSREGAAMVKRSLIALWQLVHRAPGSRGAEPDELGSSLQG